MQVGSLSPGIEVWDMDVLDAVEPVITLGGELPGSSAAAPEQEAEQEAGAGKKKQKKSKVPIQAYSPSCGEGAGALPSLTTYECLLDMHVVLSWS